MRRVGGVEERAERRVAVDGPDAVGQRGQEGREGGASLCHIPGRTSVRRLVRAIARRRRVLVAELPGLSGNAARARARRRTPGRARHLCTIEAEAVDCAGHRVPLKELFEAAHAAGAAGEFAADGHWGGSPRSVAFNAQWFRLAVDPGTGEIRVLRSAHAADAGKVMNPMQCRGQVEGGAAQALGATLFEDVRVEESGEVSTAAFRRYRLPQFADVPRTEVHFTGTTDAIGPLGAKSMSESPFNPVAPAFADALRDATGVRFTALPLTRDRVWLALDRRARGEALEEDPEVRGALS